MRGNGYRDMISRSRFAVSDLSGCPPRPFPAMIRRLLPLALLAATALLPAFAPAQKVVAWGTNNYGQLNVPNLQATQISGGGLHAWLLYPDGAPRGWGTNTFGQISYPGGLTTQVSAGLVHTLVLRPNGSVTAFGNNDSGQCNTPANLIAKQVSAGGYHSVAVRADGSVVAWGDNAFGQTNIFSFVSNVSQAAAGTYHNVGLRTDGSVLAWGRNNYGQINVPSGLTPSIQVAAGDSFSMALRSNGTVAAWGWNDSGQCNVPAGLVATSIAAGGLHALAVRPDGTVAAWGNNVYGQCNVPAGLTGVIEVSGGYYCSLAMVAYAHCVLDQTEVFAGDAATGTVKLAFPAPSGGQVVGLASDDSGVHVPASVTVPGGATTATFPLTTDFTVGPDRTITIRTTAGSTAAEKRTVPASLKVKPAKLTVAFSSATLIGGSTTKPKLTVTLDRTPPQDVTLGIASSDPAVLTLPATIRIPAGGTSATVGVVKSAPVPASRTVSAQFSLGGRAAGSGSLTLDPIRGNVTFVLPTMTSGETEEGGVYLNAAVSDTLTIGLSSGDPRVIVPATVRVAPGARFVDFPIVTAAVGTNLTVPITAMISGNPFSANLRVLAVPGVKTLTLPASVYGNNKVTGTVRLHIAAKLGGTVVHLWSSDPSLTVPETVTVPEGQYAAIFEATASDVDSDASATITASAGASSASAGVAVKPLTISSFSLSPSTAASHAAVTLSVTLNASVAVDTTVLLSSADPGLVPVPATITIPAGSRTATISVTLGATATTKNVRITATKGASSTYRTLKVNP